MEFGALVMYNKSTESMLVIYTWMVMRMMDIGGKIRMLRKKAEMSIAELSDQTGLSTGLISQIERNKVSTSVEALWKIAQVLHVSIGYFFEEEPKTVFNPVVKRNQRKTIQLANSSAVYELLSPDLNRNIEFLSITLEPNEPASEGLIGHEGEECGLVLKGEMLVKYGDQEYILKEGDSIYLDSRTPHRFINIGTERCISIWAMTPPTF